MRRTLQEEVLRMLDRQKKEWGLAARNYEVLDHVLIRELSLGDALVRAIQSRSKCIDNC